MDLLKRRIIEDGTELGTEVVKVDSFLNHQLDIGLFMAIGKESAAVSVIWESIRF